MLRKAHRACRAHRAFLVRKEYKVLVRREIKEFKEFKAYRVCKGEVLKASKDYKDCRDLAVKAHRD